MFRKIFILVMIVSAPVLNLAYADPGETDERGGHYDRLTGKYHYHNANPLDQTTLEIQQIALADAKRDAMQADISTWYGAGFLLVYLVSVPHML